MKVTSGNPAPAIPSTPLLYIDSDGDCWLNTRDGAVMLGGLSDCAPFICFSGLPDDAIPLPVGADVCLEVTP